MWLVVSFLFVWFWAKGKWEKEQEEQERGVDDRESALSRIYQLRDDIGTVSTQEWYREYQSLLRGVLAKQWGVDIMSMNLEEVKSMMDPSSHMVAVLKDVYYVPYNLDQRTEAEMAQDIEVLENIG